MGYKKLSMIGSLSAVFSLSCSDRQQYKTPENQDAPVEVKNSDQLIPKVATSNDDVKKSGRYIEATQEEVDAKNKRISQEEIIFAERTESDKLLMRGIGGINFAMSKKEVISKLGQPDVAGFERGEYKIQYLAAKLNISFDSNSDDSKPLKMYARPGYLGKLKVFDGSFIGAGDELKLSDRSDVLKSLREFARMQYNYLHDQDLNIDCEQSEECKVQMFFDGFYVVDLQNLGVISFQSTADNFRVNDFRVSKREIKSNKIEVLNLGNDATLGGLQLGNPWSEIQNRLGIIAVSDDFNRGIRETRLQLNAGVDFEFVHPLDAQNSTPDVSAKMRSFVASGSFSGKITLNHKQICVKESNIGEVSLSEICDATLVSLNGNTISNIFKKRRRGENPLLRKELLEFTKNLKTLFQQELPNFLVSSINGLYSNEVIGKYSFSIYGLDANFQGILTNVTVGSFSNPSLNISMQSVDGNYFSMGYLSELKEVTDNTEGLKYSIDLAEIRPGKPPVARKKIADIKIGSVVKVEIKNIEKSYGYVHIYSAKNEDGTTDFTKPDFKDVFTPVIKDLVFETATISSEGVGIFGSMATAAVFVNGASVYIQQVKDDEYQVVAVGVNNSIDHTGLNIPCLEKIVPFGILERSLLEILSSNINCKYLLPKDFGIAEELTSIFLPQYNAQLYFDNKRLFSYTIYK